MRMVSLFLQICIFVYDNSTVFKKFHFFSLCFHAPQMSLSCKCMAKTHKSFCVMVSSIPLGNFILMISEVVIMTKVTLDRAQWDTNIYKNI